MTTPQLNHPAAQAQLEAFPAECANFTLNISTNTSPKAPHYFGFFKFPDGLWYSVSTWIRQAPGGKQFLSNSVRPCTQAEADKQEAFEASRGQGYQQQRAPQKPQQAQANAPHNNDPHNPYDDLTGPAAEDKSDDGIPF